MNKPARVGLVGDPREGRKEEGLMPTPSKKERAAERRARNNRIIALRTAQRGGYEVKGDARKGITLHRG